MSKNDIKLPILIKNEDRTLRLMEIIYGKDDSIYFTFPRNKGYILDKISEKKFYKGNNILTKRNFNSTCKKYKNPKISFHPGKMIVHINSLENHVKKDYKILNIAPNELLLCYFIQIVFPLNYNIFDTYTKTKHLESSLIVNSHDSIKNSLKLYDRNLSLEIFIHSSNIYITEESLPLSKRDLKYMATFNSPYEYSLTICVSQLLEKDESIDNNVLININTKEKSLIYTMLAI